MRKDRKTRRVFRGRVLFPISIGSPGALDTGEDFRGGDTEGVADQEEDIDGRGFVVVLQLAQIGTVDLRRKSRLLLRQSGFLTGLAEFFAQHARRVNRAGQAVC